MGGFVPPGPGVTHEDRIFEEPDVSHGKYLLDRSHVAFRRSASGAMNGSTMSVNPFSSLACFHTWVGPCGAVSATFTSTKRAPSFAIPTRPDRDVGWQQDPADPLGHYAFGLGGGSRGPGTLTGSRPCC